MAVDLLGDHERRVLPAQVLAGGGHVGLAQRRPVGLGRVLHRASRSRCSLRTMTRLGRSSASASATAASMASRSLTEWTRGRRASRRPSKRSATFVGELDVGLALERDVVVVVEDGELAQPEPEAPGDRGRLAGDALHHVAVAGDHPRAVVDDRVLGRVEAGGEHALGHGHAHAVGEALPEGTGVDLDARASRPAPGGPACATPTAGTAGGRRWSGRSRPGAAPRTAPCRRGRPRARTGRGRSSRGRPGRGACSACTAGRPGGPGPSACPGGRSWPSPPRRRQGSGWR